MPRKDSYKPSKMQTSCECFICHKPMTVGLEHHHAIPGRNRKKCDDYGLWIWLCRQCHTLLHDKGEHDKEIRAYAQQVFIADMKHQGYPEDICKERWLSEFGKFYEL
jgi:hypothetical protein